MKCYKHGLTFTSLCAWCGKQICDGCMPVKGRKYCENCVVKLPPEHRLNPRPEPPVPPSNQRHFVMRGDE